VGRDPREGDPLFQNWRASARRCGVRGEALAPDRYHVTTRRLLEGVRFVGEDWVLLEHERAVLDSALAAPGAAPPTASRCGAGSRHAGGRRGGRRCARARRGRRGARGARGARPVGGRPSLPRRWPRAGSPSRDDRAARQGGGRVVAGAVSRRARRVEQTFLVWCRVDGMVDAIGIFVDIPESRVARARLGCRSLTPRSVDRSLLDGTAPGPSLHCGAAMDRARFATVFVLRSP